MLTMTVPWTLIVLLCLNLLSLLSCNLNNLRNLSDISLSPLWETINRVLGWYEVPWSTHSPRVGDRAGARPDSLIRCDGASYCSARLLGNHGGGL